MSRPPPPENPIAPVQPALARDTKDHDDFIDVVHTLDSKGSSNASIPHKRSGPAFVSSISKDEPIVTRKELWSYYRTSQCSRFCCPLGSFLATVYYNGDNVCSFLPVCRALLTV